MLYKYFQFSTFTPATRAVKKESLWT